MTASTSASTTLPSTKAAMTFMRRRSAGVSGTGSSSHSGAAPPVVEPSSGSSLTIPMLTDWGYFRTFTARATISPIVTSATADWRAIIALAVRLSGMVSVGLKAVAFVNET